MKKEELIQLVSRAKELGVAISGRTPNEFDRVEIDEDGSVVVVFSHHTFGEWVDEYVKLTIEDLEGDTQAVVDRHNQIRLEAENKRREEKEALEKQRKEQKEQQERETFERLKRKFES